MIVAMIFNDGEMMVNDGGTMVKKKPRRWSPWWTGCEVRHVMLDTADERLESKHKHHSWDPGHP